LRTAKQHDPVSPDEIGRERTDGTVVAINLAGPVDGQARGPLVTDAQLAALTTEYGGILHTTDRDFARFSGLRFTNPLQ
jgi:predicted nucleic acid-binding protein